MRWMLWTFRTIGVFLMTSPNMYKLPLSEGTFLRLLHMTKVKLFSPIFLRLTADKITLVAERAEMLNAKILKEACRFYEEENREAIMRLKGEITGPRRPKRLPKKYGPDTPARPSSWPREGSRPRRISKMFSRMFKKKEKPSSP